MKSDSSSHVKLWSSRCVSSVNSSRCFLSNKHRLTFKPAALLETVRAANHLLTRGSTSLHVLCAVLRRRIKNESSGCSRGRSRAGPGRAGPERCCCCCCCRPVRSDTEVTPEGPDRFIQRTWCGANHRCLQLDSYYRRFTAILWWMITDDRPCLSATGSQACRSNRGPAEASVLLSAVLMSPQALCAALR